MKKLLLAVLLTATFSATAETSTINPTEDPDVTCEAAGRYAEIVMTKRQANVSMSKLLEKIDGEFVRAVIFNAYDKPLFASQSYKENAIKSFRNEVEMECYKLVLGK